MKHPIIKLIISIVLTIVLSTVLLFSFVTVGEAFGITEQLEDASVKLDGVTMSIQNVITTYNKLTVSYSEQLATNAVLFGVALKDEVRTHGDASIRAYHNGCVLKKVGSEVILPEDADGIPLMQSIPYTGDAPVRIDETEALSGEVGLFWSKCAANPNGSYYLCVYYQLFDSYYYVNYIPEAEVEAYFTSRMDINKVIEATEEVYGGLVIGIQMNDDRMPIFHAPKSLRQYAYAADMGITLDEDAASIYRSIKIDGKGYEYAISEPFYVDSASYPLRVIFLVPQANIFMKSAEGNIILTGICFGMLLVVIVWMISVIRTIRRNNITETQRQAYSAGRVRGVMASIGAIGVAIVFSANLFIFALAAMYYRSTDCENALGTMQQMIEDNHGNQKNIAQQRESLYLAYATRIGELLSDYPELRTETKLKELSSVIGADYLMLFDENGNETLSDSRFVNLSFGTKADSSTYDFRRLNTGVSSIVHAACVDEQTGLNRQLIGISMVGNGKEDGYEALIVALKPSGASNGMTDDDIMENLTTRHSIAFSVDRDTGTILHSSQRENIGSNALDLGLSEENLRSAMLDFFRFDEANWYGRSWEFGGAIHYYAVTIDNMFTNLLLSSMLHAILFLLVYLILAAVLLFGYTEKNIDKYCTNVVKDGTWLLRRMEETQHAKGVRRVWELIRNWWTNKKPGAKAFWVMELMLGLGLIYLFGQVVKSAVREGGNGGMAIISFILTGRWTPGLNLFALTKIIVLILGTILFALVLRAIVGVLSSALHAKGKTVCHLITNLLSYAVVIFVSYVTFKTLGFDTTTLIASVGSLSLAISMASKDIIADILAGILLVFNGEYQIGEIIEVGGFRGWVANIGIRSTTLVNSNGNIKNINNRSVSNVVNLSRRNSWVDTNITVDYKTSLDTVEEMFRRELPAVREAIPKILSDPNYVGVTAMDHGTLRLTVKAECHEEDRDAVSSAMMVEIKAMFDRYEIPIR